MDVAAVDGDVAACALDEGDAGVGEVGCGHFDAPHRHVVGPVDGEHAVLAVHLVVAVSRVGILVVV